MDEGSQTLIFILIIFLLGSAYFSATETAFASVSRIKLRTRLERGDKRAKRALSVLDNFERAISTLLIGNNIVNIGASSIVTLVVTRQWGISAVSFATIATTIVILFIGEMFPKSIAKKYSERVALATAGSLCFFMVIFRPLSAVLTFIGRQAARLTGGDPEVTVTEDELYDIIEDMTEEGALDTQRGELVSSALQFSELTAETVLTARVDIVALDVEWEHERIVSFIKENRHSRLPVYKGSVDNIVGVLQIRKYLKSYIKSGIAPKLTELLDEAYFVHRRVNIDELLQTMSVQKLNMVIVSDSYGGTLGVVTVEDILEELVGEIWDEDDEVEESFIPLGGGRYEVDAELTIGEMYDKLDMNLERDGDRLEHVLLGGWVYEKLERIPSEDDSFTFGELEITVSKMRSNRIIKLEVKRESLSDTRGGTDE